MTVAITKKEKKKYVLSTKADYEILDKIKKLEKLKLNRNEKEMVKFLRTQLEKNWRKSVLNLLNLLLKRHYRLQKI